MAYVLVALSVLLLAGCTTKSPAPPSSAPTAPAASPVAPPSTGAQSAAAPVPAQPAPPAPVPAPAVPTPAPAPPAAPPAAQASPAPAPTPSPSAANPAPPAVKVVHVKVHLANLRSGPGTTMKIVRVLRQGTRLETLEERNEWLRVRLEDGQEGWIAASVTTSARP